MRSDKQPRAVVVTRPSWYEELLQHHGTVRQAEFVLAGRGQALDPVREQHEQFEDALQRVLASIPVEWRLSRIRRADLDRFLFEPEDLVLAVGQDGLVANTAKYLNGQFVLGVNPDPRLFEGVLVRLRPGDVTDLLPAAARGEVTYEERTMVEARLDDGQRILALNEIFVGHRSHQSARYVLHWDGVEEQQSSSGVIAATGTGSTGWAQSIHRQRCDAVPLPEPADPHLVFFTREAWPSSHTGTDLTVGRVDAANPLWIVSQMNDGGVLFGDGIEQDRLPFNWGQGATIAPADTRLRLVSR